ncbi:hypothetical protein GCM10009808_22000 [Microbacterium sediminicola]|uniref:HTH tetR-type domain-containing protein n=1 Tax=Microbacterium sediminicola TaxID=415210 RepID=A0ABP4UDQ2_9MICO
MTTSTDRPLRRDAAHNRDELVNCAQREFARDPRTSLDGIARAAGLTRRAVYGHFPDRHALVSAVIDRGAEHYNEIAQTLTAADPLDALQELTRRLWDEASVVQASTAIALDEAYLPHTARALAPLRARLAQIVAAGQATGSLRRDVDAHTLVRLIEETARTIILRWCGAPDTTADLPVRAVLSIAGLSWEHIADRLANPRTNGGTPDAR